MAARFQKISARRHQHEKTAQNRKKTLKKNSKSQKIEQNLEKPSKNP
jgi:hypothetical protein